MAPGAPGSAAPSRSTSSVLWSRARRIAAWSIAVGLALELALLAVSVAIDRVPDWARVAADSVQKGSWSLIVCAGVSCGMAAHRARPAVMGVLGSIAAPVAFLSARALHKGVLQAFGAEVASAGASVLTPALMKAGEYAVFGALLGWISQRPRSTLRTYLGGGLAVALVYSAVVVLMDRPPFPDVCLRLVNELVFPIGCALVLYLTSRMLKSDDS
jgi:hypothetical protein